LSQSVPCAPCANDRPLIALRITGIVRMKSAPSSPPTTMKPNPLSTATNRTPLLISLDSTSHVHLIIGSNSLAAARCTKSVESGAKPLVVAPANAEVHYTLSKRFEEGSAQWVQKDYNEEDLKTLGRAEVDGFVDAVFVTLGRRHALSKAAMNCFSR
jgi:hypothetical protein